MTPHEWVIVFISIAIPATISFRDVKKINGGLLRFTTLFILYYILEWIIIVALYCFFHIDLIGIVKKILN